MIMSQAKELIEKVIHTAEPTYDELYGFMSNAEKVWSADMGDDNQNPKGDIELLTAVCEIMTGKIEKDNLTEIPWRVVLNVVGSVGRRLNDAGVEAQKQIEVAGSLVNKICERQPLMREELKSTVDDYFADRKVVRELFK